MTTDLKSRLYWYLPEPVVPASGRLRVAHFVEAASVASAEVIPGAKVNVSRATPEDNRQLGPVWLNLGCG